MSYCRFGWDGSDVYVYGSDKTIECCGCHLDTEIQSFETPEAMIEHLIEHRKVGDYVPEYAIMRLWDEIEGAATPSRPEPEVLTQHSEIFDKLREDHWVEEFKKSLEVGIALDDGNEAFIRRFIKFAGMDERDLRHKAAVDHAVMEQTDSN